MSIRNTRGRISLGSSDNSKFVVCTLSSLTNEFGMVFGPRLFKLIAKADLIQQSSFRDQAIGMAVWDVFGMEWQKYIGSINNIRSTPTPESTVF
jgi:hypothetical protein